MLIVILITFKVKVHTCEVTIVDISPVKWTFVPGKASEK